jgi:DNA-binding NarL/FixJ family response regulator
MINIAIVDDHQMFLDGMVSVLEKQENMTVLFVANSAKVALQKIKDQTPDLIISDISMPEINGYEFIKILKKEFPSIKILVVSMYRNIQSFDGIDGFLLKETNKEELIETINTIVLNNKKYFLKDISENDHLDFKKSMLTLREKEIIILIAQEFTTEEIAEKLFLSKHTIEAHRKNIFFKLQVKNIAGLVKKAIYFGIIR